MFRLQFECGSRPMKDPPICRLSTMIMSAQLVEEIRRPTAFNFTMCPTAGVVGLSTASSLECLVLEAAYYCPSPGLIRLHGNATSDWNLAANHHSGKSVCTTITSSLGKIFLYRRLDSLRLAVSLACSSAVACTALGRTQRFSECSRVPSYRSHRMSFFEMSRRNFRNF